MNTNTKRLLNDIDFDSSSSVKHVRHDINCLVNLPDEILLLICGYLSSYHILYAFYTPSKPDRFHRMIFDYRTKIRMDDMKNDEYNYLSKLFSDSQTPLRPKSLTLSNEYVTCLINHYFNSTSEHVIQSMFNNLKHLALIDCTESDLRYLNKYITNLTQLQQLHVTICKPVTDRDWNSLETCNLLINEILFNENLSSIHAISYQIHTGLVLNKSSISYKNIRNVNLVLQTMDDLYILLDGLIPNVQTMIIKLSQAKIYSSHHPRNALFICSQLTNFTLLESSSGFNTEYIKSIFGSMRNLNKLTLSIHDTCDPLFSHGPIFESILSKYLPHLHQFQYTMTHPIGNKTLIKDFVRWPMNVIFYGKEDCRWIHIYSLPWPSNKNDKRKVPINRYGLNPPVSSHVHKSAYKKYMIITDDNTFSLLDTEFDHVCTIIACCPLISIKLPSRISKLIFTGSTPTLLTSTIIQPSIRHLIVERWSIDEEELLILAHQFPNVKYLKLNFSRDECSFINCFNMLLNQDDNNKQKRVYWPKLICFSTELHYTHKNIISKESSLHDFFIRNTNIKDHKNIFDGHSDYLTLTIWF